ncbi:MAG: CoA-binding protein [Terriglobia bacterium]
MSGRVLARIPLAPATVHARNVTEPPAPSGDPITTILDRYRRVAVVGLSPKISRPSYGVAAYLKARGYRVIAVNPNAELVFNEKCYAALEDLPEPVDLVVIFRKPQFVPEIVSSAIRIGARVIWMQEGVTHEPAARRARSAGLEVIQDRCILKEHAKRFVSDGI